MNQIVWFLWTGIKGNWTGFMTDSAFIPCMSTVYSACCILCFLRDSCFCEQLKHISDDVSETINKDVDERWHYWFRNLLKEAVDTVDSKVMTFLTCA